MKIKQRLQKIPLLLIFLFYVFACFAQETADPSDIHQFIEQQSDIIIDSLVKIRRDLHMYPELSGQEERTAEKIEDYLLSLGLEVKTNIGGYGVVGILKGNGNGKKVAWRADMDALPSDAPDVVDFESKNQGVRHICGHDVHTTIALGIANLLTSQKEKLDGTVYFIFQPAEETYQGAQAMIDDGLFDLIKPNEIYALHVTAFPEGVVATKAQNPYSHTNRVEVSYKLSEKKAAAIDFTKDLITGFQSVEPNSPFRKYENLGDPDIGLENPKTIFKNYITVDSNFDVQEKDDQLLISTTVNSSNKKQLDSLLNSLKKSISDSKYADGFISVEYTYEKATVMNDEMLTEQTTESIADIYGESTVIPLYGILPGDIGDDFAYFQNKIPGVYFFLGGSNFEKGLIADPHSPSFAVDEDCIRTGVQFFSSMIVERLNE